MPRRVSDADAKAIVTRTLESPPHVATHWSRQSKAKASGVNRTTVGPIWRAFALQPHWSETYNLSRDPLLIEKVRDIVGPYLHSPECAAVLHVDEGSPIQALDRPQPMLPLRPEVWEQQTNDDKRDGTTSLFAGLDAAMGRAIGKCSRRHRSVAFKRFPAIIEKQVPSELEIHLELDNHGTHKTAMINNWRLRRSRFHLQFTLTSDSWPNHVERRFAGFTRQSIRRASFRSTNALKQAINDYLEDYNENPKPIVRTKAADEILKSVESHRMRISETRH